MTRHFWAWLGSVWWLGLSVSACSDGAVTRGDPSYGGSGGLGSTGGAGKTATGGAVAVPDGLGVGESCSDSARCRDGLSCTSGVCELGGKKVEGDACVVGGECETGQCVARQCVAAGDGTNGSSCETDRDCEAGLRCALVGLGLACLPQGEGDVGASCATSVDCLAGLACLSKTCGVSPTSTPVVGHRWAGVTCEKPKKTGIKAYFEVPGAEGEDKGDYFRLPFPSDLRRTVRGLDLSAFPTPGDEPLGFDMVRVYLSALSRERGWGAYPTVLFRFSGSFDPSTFPAEAVQFFDVTDPTKARKLGWQRFFTSARTSYVCENFVAVQPPRGAPLEPGHTYAVFLLSEAPDDQGQLVTLLGEDKQPVVPSENFLAAIGDDAPSNGLLLTAHATLAPLRELLASYTLDQADVLRPENLLNATVFTVGDVRAPMTELARAALETKAPTASAWVKCGGKAVSPCPQAEGDRACGDDVDGYDEYHALLSLPVFQQGTPPYLTQGGGIDVGEPRLEEVCLSLTVPEGTPPAEGWPAIVFAHGTGGSFRSHVRDEVAGALARAETPFAVVGIDQVAHGPRRGDSQESPENLFFNFMNPFASRGNPLQGAADQLSVARFIKALDIDAETSTGEAIKIDGSRVLFFGHSQGATAGSLALPFGDDYSAAVLSGNGASLREALYTKTNPKNIAAALPFVLGEAPSTSGPDFMAVHPMVSLLQQWIDPADPLHFAELLGKPLEGHRAKHVFQPFGLGDSYSPELTLETFTLAAGLTQVAPEASAEPAYVGSLPQKGLEPAGFRAETGGFTLGMRQYGPPAGRDGHFVVFDNRAANEDVVRFFTGALGAEPPAIGR